MKYRALDLAGYASSDGWCSQQSSGECVSFPAYRPCTAQNNKKEARVYLVPQTLASNDGNFIANTLVGLEVQSQLGIVTFDYDFGGFLDSLRANATLYFAEI